MPDFRISPISVVNQIKSNLQDRYDSGYPILKELLQNADDAEAQRFRLDVLPGWPSAVNPLLRGPGLLVANDGVFRKQDESGITSFGESSKAADSAAIGKFGFGQKAVFHLCDAFIVYTRRENGTPFSTVVNPFLEVDVAGNISRQSDGSDQCVAALVYVYEPETRRLAARLMADHYQCAHISVARMHVGIYEGSCLEVSMLRGRRSEVETFARRIIGERGVRHGQLVAVPCKSDQ